jgi:hypothetical protein
MTMTTYNPRRLSPGAQKLRSYLYKIYGGDPRQLKERDKLEGQLSKLNDKADALRAKIAAAVRADRDSR